MNDRERRRNGLYYDPMQTDDPSWLNARKLVCQINQCATFEEAKSLFQSLLPHMDASCNIVLPFYCDLGSHIYIGQNSFLNMDCLILDEARVTIGNRVLIGPRCSIYTPIHPIDALIRGTGLETCAPVTIEDDVWIGGSVTINPGVTIGQGSIIGSGSVVTSDIEPHVIAAGNPCRILRSVSDQDKAFCRKQFLDYVQDKECDRQRKQDIALLENKNCGQ